MNKINVRSTFVRIIQLVSFVFLLGGCAISHASNGATSGSACVCVGGQCDCSKSNCVSGNGDVKPQSRSITNEINGLIVENGIDVSVVVDPTKAPSLVVTTDSNLQNQLLTETDGNTLHVYFKGSVCNPSQKKVTLVVGNIKSIETSSSAHVSVKGTHSLQKAEASSSSSIEVDGVVATEDLYLKASSSGKIAFQGTAKKVFAQADSSGKITCKGTAESMSAEASSSAKIDAKHFPAGSVLGAKASSSASIVLCGPKNAKIESSSSGSVDIKC